MQRFKARYDRRDRAVVTMAGEETIRELQDRMLPIIERFNAMFLRNLKAVRDLKASPISVNIRQAGLANVAQQQVNVKES